MGVFECVTVGDPHFDRLSTMFPTNHLLLQVAELRKPFEYALKHGIKYVVVLGDVAHMPRLSEEARKAFQKLLHEYDGRLTIWIILGNHDVAYEGVHSLESISDLCKQGRYKSVRVFAKPKQKIINGVPVNLLPFPAKKAIKTEVADRSLNFAHLERPGARRDNGMLIRDDDGVKQTDDNEWVIGHLHTPQKIGRTLYSGTLYQTNFGESLPKGFLHIKAKVLKGKLTVRAKRVTTDPRFKLINLKVESAKDLKQIDSDPLHLYKLFIKKGIKIPYDIMRRHPNVYKPPTQYTTDVDLQEKQEADPQQVNFKLTDRLGPELAQKGATKWQRKRGIKIVKAILRKKTG